MTGRWDHVHSIGDGIEREVIHTIFEDFCQEGTQWFTPHADGQATLMTSHTLATARYVSASRKRSMAILRAATALCLIRVVMDRSGSEPWFEPEPMGTEPQFRSKFEARHEPDLKSGSAFGLLFLVPNPFGPV